jgi:hypothetical protein
VQKVRNLFETTDLVTVAAPESSIDFVHYQASWLVARLVELIHLQGIFYDLLEIAARSNIARVDMLRQIPTLVRQHFGHRCLSCTGGPVQHQDSLVL